MPPGQCDRSADREGSIFREHDGDQGPRVETAFDRHRSTVHVNHRLDEGQAGAGVADDAVKQSAPAQLYFTDHELDGKARSGLAQLNDLAAHGDNFRLPGYSISGEVVIVPLAVGHGRTKILTLRPSASPAPPPDGHPLRFRPCFRKASVLAYSQHICGNVHDTRSTPHPRADGKGRSRWP